MAEEGSMALVVIGYILAIFVPIIGLIFGALLYFMKKDEVPLYAQHGKYIMIVAIILIIISLLISIFFLGGALGMAAMSSSASGFFL